MPLRTTKVFKSKVLPDRSLEIKCYDDGSASMIFDDKNLYRSVFSSGSSEIPAMALALMGNIDAPNKSFKTPEVLSTEMSADFLRYYAWASLKALELQRQELEEAESSEDIRPSALGLVLFKKMTGNSQAIFSWEQATHFVMAEEVPVSLEEQQMWERKAIQRKAEVRDRGESIVSSNMDRHINGRREQLSRVIRNSGAGYMYLPQKDKTAIANFVNAEITLGYIIG